MNDVAFLRQKKIDEMLSLLGELYDQASAWGVRPVFVPNLSLPMPVVSARPKSSRRDPTPPRKVVQAPAR
ncbi:MAG: hypothetical protein HYY16_14685 [Planctomycetes bacterium]|nr:hypothetical protein [Planctomycetota bacterium]